jgi:membrane associated rhomboid family serine protease
MIPLKDNLRCITRPTVTTLLIIINCVFFVIEEALLHFGQPYPALVQAFGMFTSANFTNAFSNADPLAMLVTTGTLFTSMFLHSGIMHIFGNMVFLNCFGRAVEARLGKKQYFAFYMLAGLAASVGQYLSNPWSHIPGLGASGAIAGVLSAYMIFFPRARIAGVSLQMGILHAPSWSFLLTWVGTQVASVVFEPVQHGGGVAYMAHIGGFVFGAMTGIFAMCLAPVGDVRYADGSRTKQRFTLKEVRSILRRMSVVLSPIRWLIGLSRRICSGVKKLLSKIKPRKTSGLQGQANSGGD